MNFEQRHRGGEDVLPDLCAAVDNILRVLVGSDKGLGLIREAELQSAVDDVSKRSGWWKALHESD